MNNPTPLDGEDEIRKAISSAFHRCRTRALRNAEVRLDHIAEAQADVIAFVKSYTATKEREAEKQGYSNGESSAHADWQFMLSEELDIEAERPFEALKKLRTLLADKEREARIDENEACQRIIKSKWGTNDQLWDMQARLLDLNAKEKDV